MPLAIGILISLTVAAIVYWTIVRPRIRINRLMKNQSSIDAVATAISQPILSPKNTELDLSVRHLKNAERESREANELLENLAIVPEILDPNGRQTAAEIVGKITNFLTSEALLVAAAGGEQLFYELVHASEFNAAEIVGVLRNEPELFSELVGKTLDVAVSPTLTKIESLGEIFSQINDATSDAIDIDFDPHVFEPDFELGFDFHLPLITSFISVSRELGLLYQNKTDTNTAIKNALLDITGTGMGGATGGAIGSALFPGIGTVLGAVAGAVIGRLLTNKVKLQPLENAIQRYKNKHKDIIDRIDGSARSFAERFQKRAEETQKQFLNSVTRFPNISEDPILHEHKVALLDAARADLSSARYRLKAAKQLAENQIHDEWYHRIAGVSVADRSAGLLKDVYASQSSMLLRYEAAIHQAESSDLDLISSLDKLSNIPSFADGAFVNQLSTSSSTLNNIAIDSKERIRHQMNNVELAKHDTVQRLQQHWENLLEKAQREWKSIAKELEIYEQQLKAELAKVGK